MNRQTDHKLHTRGMTIVEVLVTITVLSFVLGSSLGLYGRVVKTITIRDRILMMVHDADLIMMYLGKDLRNADEILSDYDTNAAQTVVVAMKSINTTSPRREERITVYVLDADRPNRLVRSVYAGQNSSSLELSTLIENITVNSLSPKLIEVELMLADVVAGKAQTWKASTMFALKP